MPDNRNITAYGRLPVNTTGEPRLFCFIQQYLARTYPYRNVITQIVRTGRQRLGNEETLCLIWDKDQSMVLEQKHVYYFKNSESEKQYFMVEC